MATTLFKKSIYFQHFDIGKRWKLISLSNGNRPTNYQDTDECLFIEEFINLPTEPQYTTTCPRILFNTRIEKLYNMKPYK